jgi:hypothetical protein
MYSFIAFCPHSTPPDSHSNDKGKLALVFAALYKLDKDAIMNKAIVALMFVDILCKKMFGVFY